VKNKIDDLRNHLFETLEALKDDEKPMELDRARAIAEVAKVIVNSAKVEVDFLKVTGAARSTDFLPDGSDLSVPASRQLNGKPIQ
jgi:CO dehydrogenase/acetyl-CoA synthase delta subunit